MIINLLGCTLSSGLSCSVFICVAFLNYRIRTIARLWYMLTIQTTRTSFWNMWHHHWKYTSTGWKTMDLWLMRRNFGKGTLEIPVEDGQLTSADTMNILGILFDWDLNWGPHLKKAIFRCQRLKPALRNLSQRQSSYKLWHRIIFQEVSKMDFSKTEIVIKQPL